MNADKGCWGGVISQKHHHDCHQKSNNLTKVSQLEFANLADEQILRLDVSMQNSPSMAIGKPSQQLEHEKFDVARIQASGMAFQVLRQVSMLE